MSISLEQAIDSSIKHYLATLEEGERVENLYSLIIGECERQLIQQALKYNNNNQSHTAEWLGITRNTLKKKMIAYGLYEADTYKPYSAKKLRENKHK